MNTNLKIVSLRSDFRSILLKRHLTSFFKNTLFIKENISIQVKIICPDNSVKILDSVSVVNTQNYLDKINYINKVIFIYNRYFKDEFKMYSLYKIMIEYKKEEPFPYLTNE